MSETDVDKAWKDYCEWTHPYDSAARRKFFGSRDMYLVFAHAYHMGKMSMVEKE